MPSAIDDASPMDIISSTQTEVKTFNVISQKLELDVDFSKRIISGSTSIVAQPLVKDLKAFRLHCRQCVITRATIEGKPSTVNYVDPYSKLRMKKGNSTIHQYDYIKHRIAPHVKENPDPELKLSLPPKVVVKELARDIATSYFPASTSVTKDGPGSKRRDSEAQVAGTPFTPGGPLAEAENGPNYAPMKIYLGFTLRDFRDGLHWVGFNDGDGRFPHVYTRNTMFPGSISSIFPCLDTLIDRCMWEVNIKCPKTLGDAFRKPVKDREDSKDEYTTTLSEEERALDLIVVCSGELVDDVGDIDDDSRHTVSYVCAIPVTARHMGFAIGPFETVDLSAEFREADEDDKLGQSAIKVIGYCLPGRSDELRNTCLPLSKAIDYFTITYGSFPFPNYKICFVDDLARDFVDTAGLSICSSRLLFPESIIDVLDTHTRTIMLALATQYSGVNIIAQESSDIWVIVGIAGFLADMFMRKLAGNNEYRFRQRLAADKLFEQDISRYSLHQLGGQLDIDPSEYDFMQLKASLVLFILDRRLTKQSGSAGMSRIITRLFLNAKTGDLLNGELTTENFLRTCEKLGHAKLDSFFKQWVYNAGCPDLMVTQRFNKKKLVVEMTIQQMQSTSDRKVHLQPSHFLREAKEQVSEAYAPEIQAAFVGPMTVRIHEADGTPYEHIIEIKDVITKFEIPYNTKYKRLKRSKKAKDRTTARAGQGQGGEAQDDVLLYCLGDTLQSEQEVKDWYLVDWTEHQENQMGQESYEWIRMDADFEWIGRINLNMPIYMYVSQLQQDRDVVAQYESIQRIIQQEPHPMGSTILVRTLMDKRYFHGIRTTAAEGLVKLAVPNLNYIGLFHLDKAFSDLYCLLENPTFPKPNDFVDRASYIVQCTIPKAMSQVRDAQGQVPAQVRKFLSDKLKFSDNSHNEDNENISDCYYLATLIDCLILAVTSIGSPKTLNSEDVDDAEASADNKDERFKDEALKELDRFRNSDEWTPTYQNIGTIVAITSLERISATNASTSEIRDILAYTRPEHAENVRVHAFQSLVNLKLIYKPALLKYLFNVLAEDPSPFIRENLMRVLGHALGMLAIGDDEPVQTLKPDISMEGGLVLEQDVSTDARQQDLARKSTPEGSLIALQQELAGNSVFKDSLWTAILSMNLSITEVNALVDIAAFLFEPSKGLGTLMLTLPLPRAWRVNHLGRAKLHFSPGDTFRVKPSIYNSITVKDWNVFNGAGLQYRGPLSKQVQEHISASRIALAQKESDKQRQLQQAAKPATISLKMSPPPPPMTSNEGSVKLSLKRKQSVEGGPSPKMQKTASVIDSGLTTSTVRPIKLNKPKQVDTHATHNQSQRFTTPLASATSRIVVLKFPTRFTKVTSILHASPKKTSALKSDGYFPPVESRTGSPFLPGNPYPSPKPIELSTLNAGGFRNYSLTNTLPFGPPSLTIKTVVKIEDGDNTSTEHAAPLSSPDDIPLALQKRHASPLQAVDVIMKDSTPPAPQVQAQKHAQTPPRFNSHTQSTGPRIMLKFGKKHTS